MQTTEQQIPFEKIVQSEIESSPAHGLKDILFKKPILIGGCGSSGTTLLKTILDSHTNIACGQEISVFDHPQIYDIDIKQLHHMLLKQDFSSITSDLVYPIATKFGDTFGLFYPNFGKEYHSMAATDYLLKNAQDSKHFWNMYFSNYACRQGKKRWAEKTPNNVFCIKEILEFFPDAKFVHVIRDGRDVTLSLTQSRNFHIFAAIMRWLIAVEAGIRFRGNPRYYEIKYEDLVTQPEDTLKKLMEFLEEDYDQNMLDFTEAGKNNPLNYGTTPIFTKSVQKWKQTKLTPSADRLLDLSLKRLLKELEYET